MYICYLLEGCVCEDDGELLGVFTDHLSLAVEPDPVVLLAL